MAECFVWKEGAGDWSKQIQNQLLSPGFCLQLQANLVVFCYFTGQSPVAPTRSLWTSNFSLLSFKKNMWAAWVTSWQIQQHTEGPNISEPAWPLGVQIWSVFPFCYSEFCLYLVLFVVFSSFLCHARHNITTTRTILCSYWKFNEKSRDKRNDLDQTMP